ncbi:MAG: hypothetical protein MJ057_08190, partial [Sphaerochaetaceae bacterium]|nr:hypothetical protein [Sphaerochaetaceae bacterium]
MRTESKANPSNINDKAAAEVGLMETAAFFVAFSLSCFRCMFPRNCLKFGSSENLLVKMVKTALDEP